MTDGFDEKILDALSQDAKLTIKELSVLVCLSPTATFERVKKLEKENIITGYFAQLDHKKLGWHLVALCYISLEKHQKDIISSFEQDIQKFSPIVECHHITGKYDYVLKIVVADMIEYQNFISTQLSNIHNIRQVESTFIMKTIKSQNNRKVAP